jgi:hypothetical protein
MKLMPSRVEWCIAEAETVQEFLNRHVARCEHELHGLALQLSIDRDYVESLEAEPGEIDYFRLQVELEQLEVEFLNNRLAILKRWQRQ